MPILQPLGYKVENYSQLTDKIFGAYKYVQKHYGNYEWYLKADDDTFIFTDNLKIFLKNKNYSEPITFGHNWNIKVKGGYESGGAGYVLSSEAMHRLGEVLNRNISFCTNTGVEDIDTADCLRKLNVKSIRSVDKMNKQLFHPFSLKSESHEHVGI